MRHPARDPLAVRADAEPVRRVEAEGAVERHQPVADRLVLQRPRVVGDRRGDGVDAHVRRERRRGAAVGAGLEAGAVVPVPVADGAPAQVGHARAPDLADAGERAAPPRRAESDVEQVAQPLQGRAVVRRAQRHQRHVAVEPPVPRLAGNVQRRPRRQPAHAVPHDDDAADRPRPPRHQPLQPVREVAAGLGDVAPAVVPRADLGRAQPLGQRRSLLGAPLAVVHADAVDQHQEHVGGVLDLGQRARREVERAPVVPELERRRERVAAGG